MTHVSTELKDSGTVTAMSVVGFVFGLLGMLGSFIPFIGSSAFYVGILAAIISAIALGIAPSQNAKKIFAVVAFTISLVGVVISGWQYFGSTSIGRNAAKGLNEIINGSETSNSAKTNGINRLLVSPFIGTWQNIKHKGSIMEIKKMVIPLY